jgi:adenosine deaminase
MDNLRSSIEIIFGKTNPEVIFASLQNGVHKQTDNICSNYPQKSYYELAFAEIRNYSTNEIENTFKKLNEDWFLDPFGHAKRKSVFYLLSHFTRQVLAEQELEPFVEYEHLLRWRELSHKLGEDIFTTSFFAHIDNQSRRNRHFFSWRPILFSTNNRLRKLLNQGLAENHFHLFGSAPVFDLSWISLMNKIIERNHEFRRFKNETKLSGETIHSFNERPADIEILVYKAAYIRHILFRTLKREIVVNNAKLNYLNQKSTNDDSYELMMDLSLIQSEINSLKFRYGHPFEINGLFEVADYAITRDTHSANFSGPIVLSGERQLLYDSFQLIYSNEKNELFSNLFFAYLLIKSKFRNELVQVNKKVGFGNFKLYQDRKSYFIKNYSIYNYQFINLAINGSLQHQNITNFETRIPPEENAKRLTNLIRRINSGVISTKTNATESVLLSRNGTALGHPHENESTSKNNEQYFHVVHFLKTKERESQNVLAQIINPRQHGLRKKVKKQALAIVELREGASIFSNFIRGIDAASSEFNARPEVFAQAFRYLKNHKLSGKLDIFKTSLTETKLYSTFHAGEDFYDIVDGMRTIDEAIKFLNLSQGDRLGHALAIGIDAAEYYQFKGRKLMIPCEMLLDNIVWLLAKIRKFGISIYRPEVDRLERLYSELFNSIYFENFTNQRFRNVHFHHTTFYDAWKLRGDNPMIYSEEIQGNAANISYWDRCSINEKYPLNSTIRTNTSVQFLYREYHFNSNVKKIGAKIKQFNITSDYIKLVSAVQKHYLEFLKALNIGIECNPTSNYLIGTFGRYAKHPIVNFYNNGLETESNKLKECPQLFVSINTDDQGIFNTSLENEYCLMAIALEKEKNEDGTKKYSPTMIYQWLDNIRKMGIEQSFQTK